MKVYLISLAVFLNACTLTVNDVESGGNASIHESTKTDSQVDPTVKAKGISAL